MLQTNKSDIQDGTKLSRQNRGNEHPSQTSCTTQFHYHSLDITRL